PLCADALQGEVQLRLLFVGALAFGDVGDHPAGGAIFGAAERPILHPADAPVGVDDAVFNVELLAALQPLPGGKISGAVVYVHDLKPEASGEIECGGVLEGCARVACERFDARRAAQPREFAGGRLRPPQASKLGYICDRGGGRSVVVARLQQDTHYSLTLTPGSFRTKRRVMHRTSLRITRRSSLID